MDTIYKLIRYNTGTDKKLFTEFADDFDAVVMNATIVAYSGSAMADLVSIYKDNYIIDPQTYILQQDIETLKSSTSKNGDIKKSIVQYMKELPEIFIQTLYEKNEIPFDIINDNIELLVQKVGIFELEYINSFIRDKEYNRYLDFIGEITGVDNVGKPQPKLLIAPYFMLKQTYSDRGIQKWMKLNGIALNIFIKKFESYGYPIAAQLVMDEEILDNIGVQSEAFDYILDTYRDSIVEYIFVWVDSFSPIESDINRSKAFALLIKELNKIGKKPIMSYGGYDAILLCHRDSPTRFYGVAQSVGYGEKRQITPVGGGLPVNKYYFPPTHQRLKTEDVSHILLESGYFDKRRTKKERSDEFYKKICSCPQCREIIGNDFDNFFKYNLSKAFTMKNGISRNRPTQEALDIAARHFLFNKKYEWNSILHEQFIDLINQYKDNIELYSHIYSKNLYSHLLEWIKNYAQ